jgi:anti-sigma-K factor RskA
MCQWVLTKELGMRRVAAKFVLGILTADQFDNTEENQAESQTENDFQEVFQKWRRRWDQCLHVVGNYFEGDGSR